LIDEGCNWRITFAFDRFDKGTKVAMVLNFIFGGYHPQV